LKIGGDVVKEEGRRGGEEKRDVIVSSLSGHRELMHGNGQ